MKLSEIIRDSEGPRVTEEGLFVSPTVDRVGSFCWARTKYKGWEPAILRKWLDPELVGGFPRETPAIVELASGVVFATPNVCFCVRAPDPDLDCPSGESVKFFCGWPVYLSDEMREELKEQIAKKNQ